MDDPRRKLIAEAMEAHDGEEWANDSVLLSGRIAWWADGTKEAARSIILSHNAIPAAVELAEEQAKEIEDLTEANDWQAKEIERLDAACSLEAADAEGLREEMADALHTSTKQAKEIERLNGLVYFGEHHFPDLMWKARCEEQAKEIEELRLDRDRWHERAMELLTGKELLGD